jgi:hypothetical protein
MQGWVEGNSKLKIQNSKLAGWVGGREGMLEG